MDRSAQLQRLLRLVKLEAKLMAHPPWNERTDDEWDILYGIIIVTAGVMEQVRNDLDRDFNNFYANVLVPELEQYRKSL